MQNKYMKSYVTDAAIGANRIVKVGTTPGSTVAIAAASTDALVGVNDNIDLLSTQTGDFNVFGEHNVVLGGTVAMMDPLTSDANGAAIKAAPATGVNSKIIGYALQAGVSGDIINYLGAPGTIQG